VATFTTIKATADSGPTTSCFTSAGGDVWFRFIASAPDVLIKIISPNIDFAAALYQGDCSQFFEVACNKNAINHSVALYHSQLLIGKSYLIRVKAQNLLGGDFQICINNYYPQPVQGADCITAFRLCDKNAFTSAGIFGYGNIKEIIDYATDNYITIVPEIEMPGHATAALAAYPMLSCSDKKIITTQKWGVFYDIFCPTEETFGFLENVLTEVIDLFPGPYIHIGGDEVPKKAWKESALCQELIKRNKLKDENELQSWFIQRIEKFVNSKGKKIIGWDEILEGGLAPNATVMSWRGEKGGLTAANQGHDVIMTPNDECYFDHYQMKDALQPLAIGGLTTLKDVYDYEPIPSGLNLGMEKHILGTQANLWAEYILTPEHLQYMAYPRSFALAEVQWSSKSGKNYTDFLHRLSYQIERLDSWKINYAKFYKTELK